MCPSRYLLGNHFRCAYFFVYLIDPSEIDIHIEISRPNNKCDDNMKYANLAGLIFTRFWDKFEYSVYTLNAELSYKNSILSIQ